MPVTLRNPAYDRYRYRAQHAGAQGDHNHKSIGVGGIGGAIKLIFTALKSRAVCESWK